MQRSEPIPNIELSGWIKWAERDTLQNRDLQGIYILAKFAVPPHGRAKPLDKAIIYVGETCKQSLGKRLYQFHRAACHGKGRHSGGKSYRKEYHDKGENLYVAVFPVDAESNTFAPLFIRYAERKIIYEYALKHDGVAPRLNRK